MGEPGRRPVPDVNGYRPPPHAPGDPLVGPDTFLAGTEDVGATWTLAPFPDRRASRAQFRSPRQIWLDLWLDRFGPAEDEPYVLREGGDRTGPT